MIFCWFTSLIDPCGMYHVKQVFSYHPVLVNSNKMRSIAFFYNYYCKKQHEVLQEK